MRQAPDCILIGEIRDRETMAGGDRLRADRPPVPRHAARQQRLPRAQPDLQLLPAGRRTLLSLDLAARRSGSASSPSAWSSASPTAGASRPSRSCSTRATSPRAHRARRDLRHPREAMEQSWPRARAPSSRTCSASTTKHHHSSKRPRQRRLADQPVLADQQRPVAESRRRGPVATGSGIDFETAKPTAPPGSTPDGVVSSRLRLPGHAPAPGQRRASPAADDRPPMTTPSPRPWPAPHRPPSVTPEDAGCLELIAARLRALGFVCERIDGGGVSNLWARAAPPRRWWCSPATPTSCPPAPSTPGRPDPFEPDRARRHALRPRRADMKILAGRLRDRDRGLRRRPPRPRRLHRPAAHLRRGRRRHPRHHLVVEDPQGPRRALDYCIVGEEPTSTATLGDTIKNGRRGSPVGQSP